MGLKKVLWLYMASFILLGGLDKKKFSYFLEPADWFTLIVLIAIIFYGFAQKRNYISEINWPDKLLFFFFTFTIFLPITTTLIKSSLNPYSYLSFLMPIRIWFVYRIFFYFLSEARHHKESDLDFEYILNAILIIGSISALIAILRYFQIPYLQEFIEDNWPILSGKRIIPIEYWGRLYGTSGGTNATGNLFGILLLFSFYKFKLEKIFIFFSLLFFICVLLSGSLSTMAGLIIALFFIIREYAGNKKIINLTIIVIIFGAVIVYKIPVLSDAVGSRFKKVFYTKLEYNIVPNNLQARFSYWRVFTNSLTNKYNGIVGFGPGGMRNDPESRTFQGGNPESFYFRILGDSGILGLFAFLILIWIILKRIKFLKTNALYKNKAFIFKIVIIFYLAAGIANQTLYYGACTEIFSILLCYIYFMAKNLAQSQIKAVKRHNNEICYYHCS